MQTTWLLVSIVIPILVSMVMWKLFAPTLLTCPVTKVNKISFLDQKKIWSKDYSSVCKNNTKKTVIQLTDCSHPTKTNQCNPLTIAIAIATCFKAMFILSVALTLGSLEFIFKHQCYHHCWHLVSILEAWINAVLPSISAGIDADATAYARYEHSLRHPFRTALPVADTLLVECRSNGV